MPPLCEDGVAKTVPLGNPFSPTPFVLFVQRVSFTKNLVSKSPVKKLGEIGVSGGFRKTRDFKGLTVGPTTDLRPTPRH